MADSELNPITPEESAAIDALHHRARNADHFALLGVARSADRKTIRDAYFAFAKEWHPDVFYQRDLGARKATLDEIFRAMTAAYDTLSNAKARAAYEAKLPPPPTGPAPAYAVAPPPPSPPPSPPSVPPPAMQSVPAQVAVPPPPAVPKLTPPLGVSTLPSMAPSLAPPGASLPPSRPSMPAAGASLPPPRIVSGSSLPPPRVVVPGGSTQPLDPALRQKAMEAMARKLEATMGSSVKARSTLPPPRVLSHMQSPEEVKVAQLRQLLEQGDDARGKGNFEQALELYKTAETLDRLDPEVRSRVDAVTQVVNGRKADDLVAKAETARKDGKNGQALELYERSLESRVDPEIAVKAAEMCLASKQLHRRGVDLAQKALLAKPDHLGALVVLAKVFAAAEMASSAKGALDRIAKIDPNHPLVAASKPKSGVASLAEQLGLRNR